MKNIRSMNRNLERGDTEAIRSQELREVAEKRREEDERRRKVIAQREPDHIVRPRPMHLGHIHWEPRAARPRSPEFSDDHRDSIQGSAEPRPTQSPTSLHHTHSQNSEREDKPDECIHEEMEARIRKLAEANAALVEKMEQADIERMKKMEETGAERMKKLEEAIVEAGKNLGSISNLKIQLTEAETTIKTHSDDLFAHSKSLTTLETQQSEFKTALSAK